ncbi:24815_t:CDS:2, partial [Cetraspora pellucida]
MSLNAIVNSSSDLGLSNTNRNYNWIEDQVYNKDAITAENLVTNVIDDQTLNKHQIRILNIFVDSNIEPLRIIIIGTAGMTESSSITVLAPTKVAVFNIHKTMIHLALSISFKDLPSVIPTENKQYSRAIYILSLKNEVNKININMLKSLNSLIARIHAIYTSNNEAFRTDSDVAKGPTSQILLAKGAHVMLRVNIYVEVGLVNSAIETVQDILFEENQRLLLLLIAVFVEFNVHNGSAIIFTK